MDEPIKYISKVEIKGLWGRYDLEWNLHSDVNVLSGVNGSGKSTILRYIFEAPDKSILEIPPKVKVVTLTFNNNETLEAQFYINNDHVVGDSFVFAQNEGEQYFVTKDSNTDKVKKIKLPTSKLPIARLIKPIDNQLLSKEIAQKADAQVETYLDWLIYLLQRDYLNYQVNILRQLSELNGNNSEQELQEINYSQKRFIEILNEVYSHTDKHVNESENEISFCLGSKKISAYQLSSGEKQILIILLNVLLQAQRHSILFMDEPEISIHFDVQKKLIDYVRELNPNVQIILATHSPAIIMDGWMDKVKEISDLIVSDNQAVLENAE